MKNHFTTDTRILLQSLKLPSLVVLMNARKSIWNFMISIQYFNMRLDEERSSAHEYSGKTIIALWASFKQIYVGKTNSWTEFVVYRYGLHSQ